MKPYKNALRNPVSNFCRNFQRINRKSLLRNLRRNCIAIFEEILRGVSGYIPVVIQRIIIAEISIEIGGTSEKSSGGISAVIHVGIPAEMAWKILA